MQTKDENDGLLSMHLIFSYFYCEKDHICKSMHKIIKTILVLSTQGEERELYQYHGLPRPPMTSHPYNLHPRGKQSPDFLLNVPLLFLSFTLYVNVHNHILI